MGRSQLRRADVTREGVTASLIEFFGGEPPHEGFFESRHYSKEEAAFMYRKAKNSYETSKSRVR